ncbi:MBL fold metallo-hydrolase [Clostridium botulinum C]|uniref:MBL fold metallo-hydrolase n=1 Tax=Clostridium botulinum TaxID=1491 RepID=UPI001E44FDCB|nr:MBL fold metallo-hydrolase [Clostridium botulinum]MCD3244643.1 MBL fold metallo-hydrolase [Clostridium botulinum C]MCD3261202.1 MBL fold metallo-hydrolase [Clostridium botulinum C]
MKITTIIENSLGDKKELYNEHGISFFIETNNGNILFDTGQSGDFIENANNLNIDLSKTDYLVLSHAHYDHCGGVKRFLDSFNVKSKFYVSNKFFFNSNKYHYLYERINSDFHCNKVRYKYIGIDFDESFIKEKKLDINYVKDDMIELIDNIKIFTNFERRYDFEKRNPNMMIKRGEEYIVDTFEDEIVLSIETEKGLLILLGCSHPGILNIIYSIMKRTRKNIYGILGGTHLVEADNNRIEKTIQVLKEMNIKLLGVSHCTGKKAVEAFKNQCDNFFVNSTGTIIEL